MNIGLIKGYNGVSYGLTYTVTAQDVTDGFVEGTFAGPSGNLPYPLAFSVVVVDSLGVNVPLADAVLTFNITDQNGYFKIEDGAATFALVADQVIHLIGQPARLNDDIQ